MSKYAGVTQKVLNVALRSAVSAGDALELPVWIVGSRTNPETLYSILIGTREMAVEFVATNDDYELTGMLQSKYQGEVGELH